MSSLRKRIAVAQISKEGKKNFDSVEFGNQIEALLKDCHLHPITHTQYRYLKLHIDLWNAIITDTESVEIFKPYLHPSEDETCGNNKGYITNQEMFAIELGSSIRETFPKFSSELLRQKHGMLVCDILKCGNNIRRAFGILTIGRW